MEKRKENFLYLLSAQKVLLGGKRKGKNTTLRKSKKQKQGSAVRHFKSHQEQGVSESTDDPSHEIDTGPEKGSW